MEIIPGNILNLNHRMFICSFALVVSIATVVSGQRSTGKGYDSEGVATNDFKTLWDVYILPHLELDLNRKISQWIEEQGDNPGSSNYDLLNEHSSPDQNEQRSSRFKRLGVAGLENLDIMTKTLDQNRLPMSVNMNSNKLRMLMRTVGRRRK
ncbi:uncharacterized protein LOC123536930 isoform X2 [Mercenaria mercenaria]|nr:uncharacterized protein LOC123536930 isoform X2 [Mercenaria mercenaria]XP_045176375.2 uncharacterized protein LOC123536930 isoform X2 [Mercenaria mercenaria]XP_045176376.2 uncharacterized protein LOC123536930 isoform X2 [Mercenaria mercenaria]